MADGVRMRRTRGLVSALFLIVLGAWAALAPYVVTHFGLGLVPNRPWFYAPTSLYFFMLPGVVIVVAGLIVASARGRALAAISALFAGLAGAWLILGTSVAALLPASVGDFLTGTPPALVGGDATVLRTQVATLTGTGTLVIFFSALAVGRVSIAAHKDHLRYAAQLARGPYQPVREQAPAFTGQYPGLPPDIADSAAGPGPTGHETADDHFGAVYERFPDDQVVLATRDEPGPSQSAAATEGTGASAEFTQTFRPTTPRSAPSDPAASGPGHATPGPAPYQADAPWNPNEPGLP